MLGSVVFFDSESGVIGSRSRLKICRSKGHTGSSPVSRTKFKSCRLSPATAAVADLWVYGLVESRDGWCVCTVSNSLISYGHRHSFALPIFRALKASSTQTPLPLAVMQATDADNLSSNANLAHPFI